MPAVVGDFNANTRRKFIQYPDITRPVGGGSSPLWQLPKTGIAARLWLAIRGSVAGSLSAPNALGMASIIRRVRLTANSGVDLINVSGAGYHYLLRDQLESELVDPFGQSNARSAVTATTFNLDMMLPFFINLRDPIGGLALQNEQSIFSLGIDWEADATVATGATVTGTVTPYLELFTVPTNREDWPSFSLVQQIVEDSQAVAATGDQQYNWPRSNTYLQIVHGLGFGVSGADNWSRARVRVNGADYLEDWDVKGADLQFRYTKGRARPAGVIPIDYMASSGLGNYGIARDWYDSARVVDLASVITATATGTLTNVRRQLINLGAVAPAS